MLIDVRFNENLINLFEMMMMMMIYILYIYLSLQT